MNRKFGKTLSRILVAASLLFLFNSWVPAKADVLENCTVTRSSLCNAVQGATQPGIVANGTLPGLSAWIDDTYNAAQINYINSDAERVEQAYGSLATGILRLSAQTFGWTSYDGIAVTAGDFFTILGPAGTIPLTASFVVDGTADLPSVGVSSLNPSVSLLDWIAPPVAVIFTQPTSSTSPTAPTDFLTPPTPVQSSPCTRGTTIWMRARHGRKQWAFPFTSVTVSMPRRQTGET
jgi:hypothetical protein